MCNFRDWSWDRLRFHCIFDPNPPQYIFMSIISVHLSVKPCVMLLACPCQKFNAWAGPSCLYVVLGTAWGLLTGSGKSFLSQLPGIPVKLCQTNTRLCHCVLDGKHCAKNDMPESPFSFFPRLTLQNVWWIQIPTFAPIGLLLPSVVSVTSWRPSSLCSCQKDDSQVPRDAPSPACGRSWCGESEETKGERGLSKHTFHSSGFPNCRDFFFFFSDRKPFSGSLPAVPIALFQWLGSCPQGWETVGLAVQLFIFFSSQMCVAFVHQKYKQSQLGLL